VCVYVFVLLTIGRKHRGHMNKTQIWKTT